MRDIIFHTQWCSVLAMVAVQWPAFVCKSLFLLWYQLPILLAPTCMVKAPYLVIIFSIAKAKLLREKHPYMSLCHYLGVFFAVCVLL